MRPSCAGSSAGTTLTASCSNGSKAAEPMSMRCTPRPSSLPRNCWRTISTPCRSASPAALPECCAASMARSRLSMTSRKLTSTSRRLRSASFASSFRMRARASSNSCEARRYFVRYSWASLSFSASLRSSSSTYVGLSDDSADSAAPLSPRAHHRRSTTFTGESCSSGMRVSEGQGVPIVADGGGAAVLQLAEQDLVGEPVADLRLNHARERPGAVDGIVSLAREVLPRVRQQGDRDPPLGELLLELDDELVDDRLHHVRRERLEVHDRVE